MPDLNRWTLVLQTGRKHPPQGAAAAVPPLNGQSPEAYALSPTVAFITFFLAVSHAHMWASPSPRVFATSTNTCFLAAGFWREATSTFAHGGASRRLSLPVGQMAGGALVLVFMGASSFAFHQQGRLGSPAHTLDIVFGWVLVAHTSYVTLAVVLLKILSDASASRWAVSAASSAASLGFLVLVALLMVFYDDAYANQLVVYAACGSVAAVFGVACRWILVFDEEGRSSPARITIVLAETAVAASTLLAAIVCQGSLLGRPLDERTTPSAYDFYHGNWHFLLALVACLLYSRARDVCRAVSVVEYLPLLDRASLLLMFLYSATAIVCKEASVNLNTSKAALGALALCFVIHALATLLCYVRGSFRNG